MTEAELNAQFPNASASFIRSNTRPAALPQPEGEPTEPDRPTNVVERLNGPRVSTDEAKLNKTEKAYLAYLRKLGHWVGIQDVTFKLAHDCRYTPDFNYLDPEGRWVFADTKGGFVREDSMIKLRVAARKFGHVRFEIIKRSGPGWAVEVVRP